MYQGELTERICFTNISRGGMYTEECTYILREHKVEIAVNGIYRTSLVCTPQYVTELVLGHLLTEGLIRNRDEIEAFSISEDGKQAEIVLTEQAVESVGKAALHQLPQAEWKEEMIFALADRMAEGMPLHMQTYGTHSCFLAKDGEILFACEDIGRHNALDKVVGYALRHKIDLSKCMLYLSGRMPSDMVEKIIRVGIPVAASKAAPTIDAVELAGIYGLTLICAARPDRMRLCSSSIGRVNCQEAAGWYGD